MAVVVGVRMPVVMGVLVIVAVIVLMRMVMGTLMRMTILRFDAGLSLDARSSAAADRAHHSTSNSFTRMSSPAATCT
jgi:Tfp pilus assembly protein PilX